MSFLFIDPSIDTLIDSLPNLRDLKVFLFSEDVCCTVVFSLYLRWWLFILALGRCPKEADDLESTQKMTTAHGSCVSESSVYCTQLLWLLEPCLVHTAVRALSSASDHDACACSSEHSFPDRCQCHRQGIQEER